MNKVSIVEEFLLMLGGTLAVSVSITLLIWLILRPDASINPLSAATVGLGIVGGTIALVYPGSIIVMFAATLTLMLAAAPTVFGIVWLLYVPPIALMAVGTIFKISHRYYTLKRLNRSSKPMSR